MTRAILLIVGLLALLSGSPAHAQNVNLNCWNPTGSGLTQWTPCNAANPLVISGGGGGGGGAVFGPDADGAPAAHAPILFGGTVDGSGTGTVGVAKVSAGGLVSVDGSAVTQPISVASLPALPANQSVNVAQFGGTSTATGQVAVSTSPVTATNTALVVDLRPDSPGIIALGQTTKSASVPVTIASDQGATPIILTSQYPNGAVPLTATATGTTAATVATLAGTAGKTTYICGFTITADAPALATGTAAVSGTISGSLSYLQTILAAANGTSDLTKNFNPCIPASAANTSVVVTSAAAGVGGNTIVNAQGYQL